MQNAPHSPPRRARSLRSLATLAAIAALLLALVAAIAIVSDPERDVAADEVVQPVDRRPHTAPLDDPLVDAPVDHESTARTGIATPPQWIESVVIPLPASGIAPPDQRTGIRGRVVAPDRATSVAFAEVIYSRENSGGVYGDSVASDAAGRFFVPLHSRPAERVQLTLIRMGAGRRDLELKDVPAEGLDLGDIELTRTPDVHFVVRDTGDQPIAGAVARIGDEMYSQSQPTDSQGRGVISNVMPARNAVRFLALGHGPQVLSVLHGTTSEASPLEVRLTPRLLLTIQVRRTDGSPAANTVVVLSTSEPTPLFPDMSSGKNLMTGKLGASSATSASGGPLSAQEPTLVVKYKSDDQGRVVVDGWRPVGRLNVRLEGRAGETIAARDVDLVWLGPRETIELALPDETRTLEIRVVDERAEPVAGATVSTVSGRSVVLAVTQTDGIARVTPLYGTTIDVRVEKGTMCPMFIDGIALNAPVVSRDVVLRDGHSVRVRTVDGEAREVAVTTVEASWNGRSAGLPQRLKNETSFTIHALPGEIVELVAHFGGRVFRVNHDARRFEAEILLPTSGRVRIELDSPLDPDRWYVVQLTADDEPDVVLRERLRPNSNDAAVEFSVVCTGRYSAELRELDAGGMPSPPVARGSVVVRSNETTVVRLAVATER